MESVREKNRLHLGCSRFPVTSPSIQSKKLRHKPGLIVLYEMDEHLSVQSFPSPDGLLMAELERGSVGVNTIFVWSWSLKFLYNSVVHQSIFWAIQQTLLSATNRWISVLHACLIWNICILIVLHYYIPEKASSEEWFYMWTYKGLERVWKWVGVKGFSNWLPL